MRVWIDVEDVFAFAESGGRRPQGIQRLAFELCQAMQRRNGDGARLRFVRHNRSHSGFVAVEWESLARLFAGLTMPDADAATASILPAGGAGRRLRPRAIVRALLLSLPPRVRDPLRRYIRLEIEAGRAFLALAATAPRLLARGLRLAARRVRGMLPGAMGEMPGAAPDGDFAAQVAPGDFLFAPGAAFMHAKYAELVRGMKQRHGMRFAMLIYDIIPLRRPEYTGIPHARSFKAWIDSVLPLCDRVFAISRSAAEETEAYAALTGIALPGAVRPIPVGTGFSPGDVASMQPPSRSLPSSRSLPEPGSYALIVSTIEIRKNHLLLVRVWRRLLDEMPADQVPTLVFAGRVGWMVVDLMQQLENTGFLGGKVVLVDHPSDGELEALYRGCLFTLFPSFYEGWGLPVSESLAFGKPCIISNTTSLPEVGGTLARYVDPEDVAGATRVIRATLEDRAGLAAWEAEIIRCYRPVPWDASAQAVLEGLEQPG